MTISMEQKVNVVPFAAREFWATPTDYEIWWEDPRDIYQVMVETDAASAPTLFYWRNSWPDVRVPKGAVVGAGESGWLANDDWTNGLWQPADCEVRQDGAVFTFHFRPLDALEFPQVSDFPAVFRRTLKLRLHFPVAGIQIRRVVALTDSLWKEAEIAVEWRSRAGQPAEWDGALEAFNGEVLEVQALNDCTQVVGPGRWRTRVQGAETSGVLARVRYADNEDRNSFDRSIVTLRTEAFGHGLPGVSFFVDDALGGEPVYIRDLGVLARPAGQGPEFSAFEAQWEAEHQPTLYDQIHVLPEQTWEQSWANMPRKTSRMYFTLGCEGSRQKFGVQPTGDIFLSVNGLNWAPGKDTPRLGWREEDGRIFTYRFGFPQVEPGDRSILEGELPVIRTIWVEGGVSYAQEAYATWLWGTTPGERREGDDPVVAMVQVRMTNLSDEPKTIALPFHTEVGDQAREKLSVRDGWITGDGGRLRLLFCSNGQGTLREQDGGITYEVTLPPRGEHAVDIRIPHIDLTEAAERERLESIPYAEEKERVAEFWRQRIAQGAQIETPNETINHFYRTHLMHMLVINDREPGADRNVARCGGFHYGSFPDEGCMAIVDLDRRGYHEEAERCLELYVHYQGSVPLPGNFQSAEGVFYGSGGYEMAGYNRNHGWVLWCLAEHYYYTRDRAWLERVAPALVKGCDWIIRERQATMRPGTIQYGFLPSGSLEDVTDYWTWLATNAYAGWGFRAAARVLAEIDHPEAARLSREAEAFNQDLRAGFFEACARSPVVRLRDGRWVPHFPARQERRGRDFGWLREVLEGACHLIYCGLIDPDEPAASWILQDYEDNLFLSEGYGYQVEDFDRQWFHQGGFSMQSNLLLFPPLYLWRDEPKHYLRGYFNGFTSAFFPDTMTMCEHALPDLAHWRGDHFKSSDEANSNGWLRDMFVNERGRDLWIGQAVPRAWFEHGKKMRVERVATHFGETSVWFTSFAATGTITVRLHPPRRNPPERILLRVRHPTGQPMQAVWVNGLPHNHFDPVKEVIFLKDLPETLEVRVSYPT